MHRIGYAVLLGLCACGPSVTYFGGTWNGNIQESFTCPGEPQQGDAFAETLTITQSGKAVSIEGTDCSFSGTVSGDTVNINPGTCPVQTYSDGSSLTLSITSGTLTLNGADIDLSITGTSSVTDSTGNFGNCSTTRIGTLN